MNETRIKNIRVLIVALIIILNLIIMANLIIKISERKRINSYNLEYNQTEKSEDSLQNFYWWRMAEDKFLNAAVFQRIEKHKSFVHRIKR